MTQAGKYSAKTLYDTLAANNSLPSFPSVLSELDAVLAQDHVTVDAVVSVLQVDVSVVARLMKTVNSARFVSHEPAETIVDAVSRLGFAATRMVAMAVTLMNMMEKPTSFSARSFWRSAFVCALASRELAVVAKKKHANLDPFSAFTLGVASGLGVFLLDQCCSDAFAKLVAQNESNPLEFVELERQALGVDHAIASAILLKSWHFPESWVMGVAGRYAPERLPMAHQPWADVLLVAQSVVYYLGYGHFACPASPEFVVLEKAEQRLSSLGLVMTDLTKIITKVEELVDKEGWLAMADEAAC